MTGLEAHGAGSYPILSLSTHIGLTVQQAPQEAGSLPMAVEHSLREDPNGLRNWLEVAHLQMSGNGRLQEDSEEESCSEAEAVGTHL